MPADDGMIYMGELCERINRRPNTVHVWELQGVLPRSLLPTRGTRGWRCWTPEQVDGIVKWMKDTDRRPGRNFAEAASSERQLVNMRRPKFLKKHHINQALDMIEQGKSARQIAQKLHPKTPYKRWQNVDTALRRYFDSMGWPYPPKDPIDFPEIGAQKIVRRFDKAVKKGDIDKAIKIVVK